MSDLANYKTEVNSPAAHAAEVTPNDSTDLTTYARGLYVGGAGDVEVTTVGGETVTFVGVSAGTVLPVRVKRVLAGSTTATDIIALY